MAVLLSTRDQIFHHAPVAGLTLKGPGFYYALTAYVLALNKIIGENDAMNAETLPKVRMPNRDGFIPLYPSKH